MTIFVSIASYRDPLLRFTLLDAYHSAKNKKNIVFGVVEQETKEFSLDLDSIPFKEQIRYVRIEPEQSRGCCWSRSLIQSLYFGERYYLQIDSHTAFDQDWDVLLIQSLENLLAHHPKPLITGYPDQLRFDDEGNAIKAHRTQHVSACKLIQPRPESFTNSNTRFIRGCELVVETDNEAIHGFMLAAGGLFTLGKIVEEVPYDPYLLFDGEEPTLALRLWTHGWNIFHIRTLPFYHQYTHNQKNPRVLFWNETEEEKRNFSWVSINIRANERLDKILLGKIHGPYGLGHTRTLDDFKCWSGIDYINRVYKSSRPWALDVTRPPEELLHLLKP